MVNWSNPETTIHPVCMYVYVLYIYIYTFDGQFEPQEMCTFLLGHLQFWPTTICNLAVNTHHKRAPWATGLDELLTQAYALVLRFNERPDGGIYFWWMGLRNVWHTLKLAANLLKWILGWSATLQREEVPIWILSLLGPHAAERGARDYAAIF